VPEEEKVLTAEDELYVVPDVKVRSRPARGVRGSRSNGRMFRLIRRPYQIYCAQIISPNQIDFAQTIPALERGANAAHIRQSRPDSGGGGSYVPTELPLAYGRKLRSYPPPFPGRFPTTFKRSSQVTSAR